MQIQEKQTRKIKVRPDLSIFDEELTVKFNPKEFIPDTPLKSPPKEHKEYKEYKAPVKAAPSAPMIETVVEKTLPKYTLSPSSLELSLIDENQETNSTKIRFSNPGAVEVKATIQLSGQLVEAWLLNLSGKRYQSILLSKDKMALSIPVKPRSLICLELVFANSLRH